MLRASQAIANIETAISPNRLAQLNACRPGPGLAGVALALHHAAELCAQVCAEVSAREGWPWPARLADRVRPLLAVNAPKTDGA